MGIYICIQCGSENQTEDVRWRPIRRICTECKAQNAALRKVQAPCKVCGNLITTVPWMKKRGVVCSDQCRKTIMDAVHKKTGEFLSNWNKQFGSARMKEKNPMHSIEVVERMKTRKRVNGTLNVWKGERGGNGKITTQQEKLAIALGWDVEVSIPTITLPYRVEEKLAKSYKVDIGNQVLKIAVEVDGAGHNTKRIQILDKKKEKALRDLGWLVLRFTNQEIDSNLAKCLIIISRTISRLLITTTTS